MKNPIKIIHKFKNNNLRIQYKIFIFVGSLLDESIMKILKHRCRKYEVFYLMCFHSFFC